MPKFMYVVFSTAVEGREAEFNEWYTNTHLPDALKVPGIVAARRYKFHATRWDGAPQTLPDYLAVYEVDCDDVDTVRSEIHRRAGTEEMMTSDTMDIHANRSGYFLPLTDWMKE